MNEVPRRILQDDDNFLIEVIDWRGQPAVKKTVKPTAPKFRAERLKIDVQGMQFFFDLAEDHQDLELYIPKLYETGEDFYIREYVNCKPFLDEAATFEQAKDRLDKLAQLLAGIDRLEPAEKIGYSGSSDYRNLEESIGRWADENTADKIITAKQASRAKQISTGLGNYLQPRIAHGDLSAYKHTFLKPDGKIALIDFEVFSTAAARYFDAAWTFTRLWSFASSTAIPKYFLASFLAKIEPTKHQSEQLTAVLIQRTLGMQKDAASDLNSKAIDYRSRAKELLELVLQNKLELLHD